MHHTILLNFRNATLGDIIKTTSRTNTLYENGAEIMRMDSTPTLSLLRKSGKELM